MGTLKIKQKLRGKKPEKQKNTLVGWRSWRRSKQRGRRNWRM